MDALQRAVEIAGGQVALARDVGVTPQAVHLWLRKKTAPPARCLAIEAATNGAVTCHELRPDIYPPPASAGAAPQAASAEA